MVWKTVQKGYPLIKEIEMYSTYSTVVDHPLIDPAYYLYEDGAI